MKIQQKRRFAFLCIAGSVLIAGMSLILVSLRDNLLYFVSPSQLLQMPDKQKQLRLGGLVRSKSVVRHERILRFVITDGQTHIPVRYTGLVPDLFHENQEVVVEGQMMDGIFIAQTLLVKHDERYMPRALKEQR